MQYELTIRATVGSPLESAEMAAYVFKSATVKGLEGAGSTVESLTAVTHVKNPKATASYTPEHEDGCAALEELLP